MIFYESKTKICLKKAYVLKIKTHFNKNISGMFNKIYFTSFFSMKY